MYTYGVYDIEPYGWAIAEVKCQCNGVPYNGKIIEIGGSTPFET